MACVEREEDSEVKGVVGELTVADATSNSNRQRRLRFQQLTSISSQPMPSSTSRILSRKPLPQALPLMRLQTVQMAVPQLTTSTGRRLKIIRLWLPLTTKPLPSSIISLVRVRIVNKAVLSGLGDENGEARRRRKTWRHSGREALTEASEADIAVVGEAEALGED